MNVLLKCKTFFNYLYVSDKNLQSVDVKYAVQVVCFVLEDDCSEALDPFAGGTDCHLAFGEDCIVLDFNVLPSLHVFSSVRNREAAFRSGDLLAVMPDNSYVSIDFKWLSLLVESLHGHDSAVQSDLRAGYADSVLGGVSHCGYHPAGQD